jgi:hypothetical protein
MALDLPKVVEEDSGFEELRPKLMWLPAGTIKKTWERAAQCAKMPVSDAMKKRHKSPNPALNAVRRGEAVATDAACSGAPAVQIRRSARVGSQPVHSQVCSSSEPSLKLSKGITPGLKVAHQHATTTRHFFPFQTKAKETTMSAKGNFP